LRSNEALLLLLVLTFSIYLDLIGYYSKVFCLGSCWTTLRLLAFELEELSFCCGWYFSKGFAGSFLLYFLNSF
jgi:hypothetical protein